MSLTPTPTPLRLAVCLYPTVASIDFIGHIEIMAFLTDAAFTKIGSHFPRIPELSISVVLLSHSLEPVTPVSGIPTFSPDGTYSEQHEQFDMILVPGGLTSRPEQVDPSLIEFIKKQTPGAKYVLSICTGAWILAGAGVLDGKKATTSKYMFRVIEAATNNTISWIPKARWVVDGNVWTSAGVTSGMDMTNAFVAHLVGEDIAQFIRGIMGLSVKPQYDDELAVAYGLV